MSHIRVAALAAMLNFTALPAMAQDAPRLVCTNELVMDGLKAGMPAGDVQAVMTNYVANGTAGTWQAAAEQVETDVLTFVHSRGDCEGDVSIHHNLMQYAGITTDTPLPARSTMTEAAPSEETELVRAESRMNEINRNLEDVHLPAEKARDLEAEYSALQVRVESLETQIKQKADQSWVRKHFASKASVTALDTRLSGLERRFDPTAEEYWLKSSVFTSAMNGVVSAAVEQKLNCKLGEAKDASICSEEDLKNPIMRRNDRPPRSNFDIVSYYGGAIAALLLFVAAVAAIIWLAFFRNKE